MEVLFEENYGSVSYMKELVSHHDTYGFQSASRCRISYSYVRNATHFRRNHENHGCLVGGDGTDVDCVCISGVSILWTYLILSFALRMSCRTSFNSTLHASCMHLTFVHAADLMLTLSRAIFVL